MILHCKTVYCYRTTSQITSTTSGTLTTCNSWRKKSQKGPAVSVFHRIEPMYANQDQEEVQYDLDKPRIVVHKNTWRVHQTTVYCCN